MRREYPYTTFDAVAQMPNDWSWEYNFALPSDHWAIHNLGYF